MGEGSTFSNLEARATQQLRDAGVNSPERDVNLLLQAASGLDKVGLISRSMERCPPDIREKFENYVTERSERKPVHRILGRREFHGLDLTLSSETLEPRDDTECLIEATLFQLAGRQSQELKFLDLGTGTGAVALALLDELPNATAVATDLNASALKTAEHNAVSNGFSKRFETLQSNWFENVEGQFDFIVSNPPYIASSVVDGLEPEVLLHDPRLALDGGVDGLNAYRKILTDAHQHLKHGGFVALEIGHDQNTVICRLAAQTGWQVLATVKDLGDRDRVVVVQPLQD